MTPTDIARVCHEANRTYCLAVGLDAPPTWAAAPEWQRDSVIAGVNAQLDNPATARESHERWLAYKRAEGWSYGLVKDPEAKTHPCFLPYDELGEMHRVKDELFVGIVNALRSQAGIR